MKAFYTILLLIVSNIFMTFCLVWASEATRDKSHLQLAVVCRGAVFLGNSFGRVFLPGSGQSDRLFRQWRPVLIDATQSDSGSNHFDYLYGVHNGSFQGGNAALESFCRFCMSGTGGIFCIL